MATTPLAVLRLQNPIAPRLPAAPVEYSARFQEQFESILRLYFNQIDATFAGLLGADPTNGSFVGGRFLNFPYGSFYDDATQIAASTTVAYPITLAHTAISNAIAVESNSHIKATYAGIYNIQFSIQLANTTNAPQDIDIWFKLNGTDIAQSNSRFGLAARKGPSDPYHTVGTVNLFVEMQAGDFVELYWCTTNVGAQIQTYAAGTGPTRPAVPSVIVTANFVSALSTRT